MDAFPVGHRIKKTTSHESWIIRIPAYVKINWSEWMEPNCNPIRSNPHRTMNRLSSCLLGVQISQLCWPYVKIGFHNNSKQSTTSNIFKSHSILMLLESNHTYFGVINSFWYFSEPEIEYWRTSLPTIMHRTIWSSDYDLRIQFLMSIFLLWLLSFWDDTNLEFFFAATDLQTWRHQNSDCVSEKLAGVN